MRIKLVGGDGGGGGGGVGGMALAWGMGNGVAYGCISYWCYKFICKFHSVNITPLTHD